MARITGAYGSRIYAISRFLGVNEGPAGDTKLKMGEAAEMRNFRITKDGALQIRPGTLTIVEIASAPVKALWSGYVDDAEHVVAACDDKVWDIDIDAGTAAEIGAFTTTGTVTLFGYSEKLYMLNGTQYKEWDGTTLSDVTGYRPLVTISVIPAGGGTELESINMLNGLRRVWFSPNGTATEFQLPETGLTSIDYVTNLTTGTDYTVTTDYTVNTTTGKVTFTAAPDAGTNTIEIGYTYPTTYRAVVLAMKYMETYNGVNDNRVFLYGDGTNKAYYSDLDYDGTARADYFPDLNVVHVGDANTPITSMIRHYDRLLAFKLDSAYSLSYDTITLVDGSATAGFYVRTVNKSIGNCAYGQAQLVVNYPRTLDGKSIYEWKATTTSGNITGDQRNAKAISERVEQTLSGLVLADVTTYTDKYNHDYYVMDGDTALVHNYDADAWFIYTDFAPTCLLSIDGELYGGTADGDILHVSRNHSSDDGAAIDAYMVTGAMSFNTEWQRKYLTRLFLTMVPEERAAIDVSLVTNNKADYVDKTVSYGIATFIDSSFVHWSFGTSRQPQTERIRIKAKKFSNLRLVLSSNTNWRKATVESVEFKIRQMGDVK